MHGNCRKQRGESQMIQTNLAPDFSGSVSCGEGKCLMFDYYLSGDRADCYIKYMDRRKRANCLVSMKWTPVSNFFLHFGIKKV